MSAVQFPLPGIEPVSVTPPGFLDYWRVGGLDNRVGMYRGYDEDMVILLFPDGSLEKFYPHQLFPALNEGVKKDE